jgi:hypothetical protein
MTPLPDEDSLFTLNDVCEIVFGGKIKVATLRAEIGRGNLTVFRVGRRDFTTLKHVREMVQRCRVASPLRGSISTEQGETGSSATEKHTYERDALRAILREPSVNSRTTSSVNISPSRPPRRRSSTSSTPS